MSKIKFNQVDDTTIEVTLSKDTPLDMVTHLNKSLTDRGMIEDVSNSTLSVRRFYIAKKSSMEDIADQLIKSLMRMNKEEDSMSPMERRRKMMAESQGVEYKPGTVVPNVNQSFTGRTAIPQTPEQTNIDRMNQLKKPAPNVLPKKAASEDGSEVNKGDYGPKGAGLYNPADNARRKASNVGDVAGEGPNKNVKAYSSRPGQQSAKAQADLLARQQAKLNRKQPIKVFSEEEKQALASKMNLKKGWADHLPFPSAEQEIMNFAATQKGIQTENQLSNQLANLMSGRSMLGQGHRQPTSEEMIAAGQSMGMGISESTVQKADTQWNNSFNNWLVEASKPISQRFSSEEEEQQYWSSIGIQDKDDGRSGY